MFSNYKFNTYSFKTNLYVKIKKKILFKHFNTISILNFGFFQRNINFIEKLLFYLLINFFFLILRLLLAEQNKSMDYRFFFFIDLTN